MTREYKSVLIATLILILFGAFIFVQYRAFIMPYPLSAIIFGVVAIQFSYWNRKLKGYAISLAIAGVFSILSTPFLWETFISVDLFASLQETIIIDVIRFLFALSITTWIVFCSFQLKEQFPKIILFLSAGIFLILYLTNYTEFLIGCYALMFIPSQITEGKPKILAPALLLFLFEALDWITYLVN